MKRREFIAGLGGAVTWPVVAEAQQAAIPRIGYVFVGVRGGDRREQCRAASGSGGPGDIEIGRNSSSRSVYAEGSSARIPALIFEARSQRRMLLVTVGTVTSRAAQRATATVPIVLHVSATRSRLKLVESLSHPGGNITGMSLIGPVITAQNGWHLLKEAAPNGASCRSSGKTRKVPVTERLKRAHAPDGTRPWDRTDNIVGSASGYGSDFGFARDGEPDGACHP